MPRSVLDIEVQRLTIQARLDLAKTTVERNRLGQFATPPNLALDIARYALGLWQGRTVAVTFLDPAIGSGSFYSALAPDIPDAGYCRRLRGGDRSACRRRRENPLGSIRPADHSRRFSRSFPQTGSIIWS